MFVHGCLIYNLCGAAKHRQDPKFSYNLQRTCEGLIQELDVVAGAGGEGVIVHPNSCHDAAKGLYTASQTIRYVLSKSSKLSKQLSSRLNISPREFIRKRRLILENSAHEGGKRGWNLEELRDMIQGVPEMYREQIGICIDTAHAFGAGIYDFGRPSEIKRFYCDFERVIGLKYLKVFHLNDSMASEKKANNAYFGSCKDRHQNLGLGYIFGDSVSGESDEGSRLRGLREFFDQARKRGISIIGEPPASSQGGIYDWEVVRELLKDSEYPLERVVKM
jgi:endonuclease IV